ISSCPSCPSCSSWLISAPLNEGRTQTLDERAQMTDLERLRHSASHVLAAEILKSGRPTVRPPSSHVQDCDQGLSRTILPSPGGTKAVPSATYTAPLGPTATPPVKESAPPARN